MSLVANSRCIACDADVHSVCFRGDVLSLDVDNDPDGAYVIANGSVHRVVSEREPDSIYTIKVRFTHGMQRFADHRTTCRETLRPAPTKTFEDASKAKTQKTPIRERRPRGS